MNWILIFAAVIHVIVGCLMAGMFIECGNRKNNFGAGLFCAVVALIVPFSWIFMWLIGRGALAVEKRFKEKEKP